MNHKLIQRAQNSSRKVITKMVRLGRRCTQNLTTIKNVINHSVAKAIANAHSMLEETSTHNGMSNAQRGQGIQFSENRKVEAVKESKEGDATAASQRDHSSVRVPPNDAFTLTPSWMLGGAERMSSKAVSMAKKTIRNARAIKGEHRCLAHPNYGVS